MKQIISKKELDGNTFSYSSTYESALTEFYLLKIKLAWTLGRELESHNLFISLIPCSTTSNDSSSDTHNHSNITHSPEFLPRLSYQAYSFSLLCMENMRDEEGIKWLENGLYILDFLEEEFNKQKQTTITDNQNNNYNNENIFPYYELKIKILRVLVKLMVRHSLLLSASVISASDSVFETQCTSINISSEISEYSKKKPLFLFHLSKGLSLLIKLIHLDKEMMKIRRRKKEEELVGCEIKTEEKNYQFISSDTCLVVFYYFMVVYSTNKKYSKLENKENDSLTMISFFKKIEVYNEEYGLLLTSIIF
jgi:hypothetical protein